MPSIRNEYPNDWHAIAWAVKARANWKCIRCGHDHETDSGYMLTVHHLDSNKGNCAWWNLAALCQRCHLSVQARVRMSQGMLFPHLVAPWFVPYLWGRNVAIMTAQVFALMDCGSDVESAFAHLRKEMDAMPFTRNQVVQVSRDHTEWSEAIGTIVDAPNDLVAGSPGIAKVAFWSGIEPATAAKPARSKFVVIGISLADLSRLGVTTYPPNIDEPEEATDAKVDEEENNPYRGPSDPTAVDPPLTETGKSPEPAPA